MFDAFTVIPLQNWLIGFAVLAIWGLGYVIKIAVFAMMARYGTEFVSRGWHRGKKGGR